MSRFQSAWQHAMSRMVGRIANTAFPRPIMSLIIRAFASTYDIKLNDAELPISEYTTLGQFFTRSLRPSLRPIASGPIVAPTDGTIIQTGPITEGMAIQAKGKRYSVASLTGTTHHYSTFATIYLSPSDCHRIFSPVDGKIVGSTYIHGCLYPVRHKQLESIPHLYCKNERLITHFETPNGRVTLVAVGALNVGTLSTEYNPHQLPVDTHRGDWVTTFHLGSTVVILCEKPMGTPPLGTIRYGEALFTDLN
ncbi:phosphatidylserine decarboxylase [bacterium]|nr:phosphatidylserine decarboxylase [bacterium]